MKAVTVNSGRLRMLVLSLTGLCNLRCSYCYAAGLQAKTMTWELAQKALTLAAQLAAGPFVLQFSGGEPLLAFDLIEKIARYVQQEKIPAVMQLQTNAILLDETKAKVLLKEQVGVGISLDGLPAINDSVRCDREKRGYTSAIAGKAAALSRLGLNVGITCVAGSHNVEKLSDVIDMAFYMGNVRRIGFDLLRNQGRAERVRQAEPQRVRQGVWQALERARRLENLTEKSIVFSQLEGIRRRAVTPVADFRHCHAITGEKLFIDSEGRIYPCPSLTTADFLLGDVVQGMDYAKWQQVTEFCRAKMSFCRQCPDLMLCGGGCFARWFLADTDKDKPHAPECALKQTFIDWYKQNQDV